MTLPMIIQGGMGAGVSSWQLAREVARRGQLGVVSGTALDSLLVRRLQNGDPGGHLRRAMENFPAPWVTDWVLKRFYIEGGRRNGEPYTRLPLQSASLTREQTELLVLANFVEVWLAREGHGADSSEFELTYPEYLTREERRGTIGINLLEKIQVPNLASLYGAMLAGVDYVLMGAGIPWQIPGILDKLAHHQPVSMIINVEGAQAGEEFTVPFDPRTVAAIPLPLTRPRFLAIVSSSTLATALVRRTTGRIDGFVVERHTAGGHNAPPRGPMHLSEDGEPVYGPRDQVDWAAFRKLGLPYWVAGSCASPERLREARALGAQGIQVGTLFALCEESGLTPPLRQEILELCRAGKGHVFTDPAASPTGFPFKVVELKGTLTEPGVYAERPRVCDLGYLRHAYRRDDGTVGFRCPAEPQHDFVKKGGEAADTFGRKCLCNALTANVGLEQTRNGGYREPALVTAGSDLSQVTEFLANHPVKYHCGEVIDYLLEPAMAR